MPSIKPNESKSDYVNRCIPIVLEEGTAAHQKQAVAMCHSMYDQAKKAEESGELVTESELVRRAKMDMAKSVSKEGYYGGPDFRQDPHIDDMGAFVGRYDGCVEHMIECEGYDPVSAQNTCSYLRARDAVDEGPLDKGPEQPEFNTLMSNIWKEEAEKGKKKRIVGDKKKPAPGDQGGVGDSSGPPMTGTGKAELTKKYDGLEEILKQNGDFGGDYDTCYSTLKDEGYDPDAADEICSMITEKSESGFAGRIQKDRLDDLRTSRGSESIFTGSYPEPDKPEMPKFSDGIEDIEKVVLPESLIPRGTFGTPADEVIPAMPKKDVRVEEGSEGMKAHPFGELPDEIKVKQP